MTTGLKTLLIAWLCLMLNGCAHFGLDSEADIAAENCYAYRYGDKLRRINFAKAFDWCHRSARWGDANSQALVGELHYMGLGGKRDLFSAAQWFDKAARQGHAHAQYMLYRIYSLSDDPDQREQAIYWLQQARQSGYKLALQVP
ncbi:tetratricopeptide repeat protein [Methylotuvimicrobium sp. KM1]|uniref:tetratricopeptide repeat protein n=1 Tax=Methylotuvimicrobium sp. KM1 TaxID=3377707 RepID=UPI00384B5535